MAQKPNLHGLQNYSLRSGKYAIDPNAKSRKDGETKHERRLAPIERIKEALNTNDVYFGLGLTTDDLNALASAIELFVYQFPIVRNTALYFGDDLIRFDNSGETAKVVNFKNYLYKADTTKQTTAYVMPDMYNQTKKFIVGSPSKTHQHHQATQPTPTQPDTAQRLSRGYSHGLGCLSWSCCF